MAGNLHPNVDLDVPPPYKEGKGMGQVSKLYDQEKEASGNLPESSDPVVEETNKPFRITYP